MKILSKTQQNVLRMLADYGTTLVPVTVSHAVLERPYEEPQRIDMRTVTALVRAGCLTQKDSHFALAPIDRAKGVVKPCVLRWDRFDYYLTDEAFLAQIAEEEGHTEDLDEDGEPTEAEWEWRDCALSAKEVILGEEEEWGWRDALDELEDLMCVFPSVHLQVHCSNFGWLHQDGEKTVRASDGADLLRAILPNTDCTWEVYHYIEPFTGKKGLALQNWHHDAPMGGEWYYITERGDEDAL